MIVLTLQARAAESNATVEWPMYHGNYHADRNSPLKQITPENVGSLKEVGRYELPETTAFQTNPIVVDGRLFVTTATSTYAVDAPTGKLVG